jgi:hypothetical protein
VHGFALCFGAYEANLFHVVLIYSPTDLTDWTDCYFILPQI